MQRDEAEHQICPIFITNTTLCSIPEVGGCESQLNNRAPPEFDLLLTVSELNRTVTVIRGHAIRTVSVYSNINSQMKH